MTSSTDYSKLSDEQVGRLFLQALQVYEDQISIMDFLRKKVTEVRNDIHDLEKELAKRNVEIKNLEKENE